MCMSHSPALVWIRDRKIMWKKDCSEKNNYITVLLYRVLNYMHISDRRNSYYISSLCYAILSRAQNHSILHGTYLDLRNLFLEIRKTRCTGCFDPCPEYFHLSPSSTWSRYSKIFLVRGLNLKKTMFQFCDFVFFFSVWTVLFDPCPC